MQRPCLPYQMTVTYWVSGTVNVASVPVPLATAQANGGWHPSITMDGSKLIPTGLNKTCALKVTGTGHEIIEVLEVGDGLAKFRQYIVNPSGVRLSWLAVPKFETINEVRAVALRKKLKRLKMLPWHKEAKPEEAPEPVAKSADIISFPTHRIIRRVEHGPGVVVSR